MAYLDAAMQIQNDEFKKRIKFSIRKQATLILGGVSTGKPAVDSKREALASVVLAGGRYEDFLETVSAMDTANIDSAVDNQVIAVWNKLAGVTLADNA